MDRYARQIRFPRIGEAGQARLAAARVLLVGCGALGTWIAEMLVRAGVGRLVIVDRDVVDSTNLNRQCLFTDEDARRREPKAGAARRALLAINPDVEVAARAEDFGPENAEDLAAGTDLLLDGTDNLETRYLLNDLAVKLGVPWIYGACVGARGMSAVILPGETPCLRCLFPEPLPPGAAETCDTAGIIAPAAALVAALEAAEALKLLTGDRAAVRRGLFTFDLWPFRAVSVLESAGRREDCPTCGRRSFEFLHASRASGTVTLCGRNAVQILPARKSAVDLPALAARLRGLGTVAVNEYLVTLEADGHVISVFGDGRGLVQGTGDPAAARAIFMRYVSL